MAHPSRNWRLATPLIRSLAVPTRTPSSIPQSLLAPFSTTTSTCLPFAAPGKGGSKGSNKGLPAKGERSAYRNKRKRNKVFELPYQPAPGERRATRRRVVLTNVNALDVELEDFNTDMALDAKYQGQIVGLPGPLVDRLRAAQAFRATQAWGWFKRPSFLIRPETAQVAHMLEGATSAESTPRWIITGDVGSGKSLLLLQAQAMAFLKDWVVISIPEGNELTIAHTTYAPIADQDPPLYSQNAYTIEFLNRIANTNPILQKLEIQHPKTKELPYAASLKNLSELCLSANPESQHDGEVEPWAIFEALWRELRCPGRPPLLVTLDGLSHFMENTEYRHPDFTPIHAHDLILIRWFVEHLSGARQLPNGGAVIAATCTSCGRDNPTLASRLKQLKTGQALAAGTLVHDPEADPMAAFLEATGQQSQPIAPMDPNVHWDERVLEVLSGNVTPQTTDTVSESSTSKKAKPSEGKSAQSKGSQVPAKITTPPYLINCPGLDRAAARSLMEYWAKSGMLRAPVTGSLVAQQWTEAGGGVVGELERGCLKMRI